MRADALHRLLLSARGASARTVEEIEALPDLASWNRLVLQVAIGDAVHDGRLADDESGRIHVEPVGGAA